MDEMHKKHQSTVTAVIVELTERAEALERLAVAELIDNHALSARANACTADGLRMAINLLKLIENDDSKAE